MKAFQVYTGRTVEGRNDVGLCSKVVLDLLSDDFLELFHTLLLILELVS